MSSRLKKILISLTVLILAALSVKYFSDKQNSSETSKDNLPIIAITQIVEHSALDQEREGVIEVLAKAGYIDGQTVKIVYQNAQGNIGTAAQITAQMISLKPKLVLTLSTPSAQAALGPCLAQNIPLVFSTVTDPLGAKLVKDLNKRTEAVTGVSDNLPMESQIQLVQDFIPGLKTLGVIYNAGEVNSVKMVKAMHEEAAKHGIQIVEAVAGKTSDVASAMNNLVGRVQAVYVPNDNTAVAAMNSIVQIGEKHKLPVFAGDTGSVKAGAIATRGYDRFALGRKAGELVLKILKGTPAGDLPLEVNHSLSLMINKESAEKMGVIIPQALLQTATVIGD
ncbi:MAG: ABC transporter substrate-binding protein [Alphaproteobacteria bacterium]|nr:ABC transporter substrate-binding protein [Alphaproteobacteria bacterium]